MTKNSTSHLSIMTVLHNDGFIQDKSIFIEFSKNPPQISRNVTTNMTLMLRLSWP